jgi:CheY-like chemotaxis protein
VRRFLDCAPSLEIRLISTLPTGTLVPGRASFLARTVLNLLNNAARFARSEVRLTLAVAASEEERIEVVVEDDGPGISPSFLPGAFRPLVQGDRAGLAGFGLSSVSWAVQQLGGEIAYRTGSSLGGARFDVALPAIFPARSTSQPRLDLLLGKRLVLLEDDPAVQRALARLLRRLGADVTAFDPRGESEDDILRVLLRAMPDIILLDLRLGVREGDEIWRALKTQVPALAQRVIFVSALAPGEPQWEAARATGQPVLPKPLDTADLAGAVAHVLAKHTD